MITFNNVALPDWVSVTGVNYQTLNLSVLEHETKRRLGNIDAGVDRGGLTINCDLLIEPRAGLTLMEQADQLKRFMKGEDWNVSPLVLTEQPDKFYNARVSNASEVTDNFTHGTQTITFYCADARKYDTQESVMNSTNGEAVVSYTGIEKATATISVNVTTAVTNLEITHQETGRKMVILGDLTPGQTVTIDTQNRNIKIDGNGAKDKMAFESKWLFLQEGTNTLTCSSPDLVTNDFDITYRTTD